MNTYIVIHIKFECLNVQIISRTNIRQQGCKAKFLALQIKAIYSTHCFLVFQQNVVRHGNSPGMINGYQQQDVHGITVARSNSLRQTSPLLMNKRDMMNNSMGPLPEQDRPSSGYGQYPGGQEQGYLPGYDTFTRQQQRDRERDPYQRGGDPRGEYERGRADPRDMQRGEYREPNNRRDYGEPDNGGFQDQGRGDYRDPHDPRDYREYRDEYGNGGPRSPTRENERDMYKDPGRTREREMRPGHPGHLPPQQPNQQYPPAPRSPTREYPQYSPGGTNSNGSLPRQPPQHQHPHQQQPYQTHSLQRGQMTPAQQQYERVSPSVFTLYSYQSPPRPHKVLFLHNFQKLVSILCLLQKLKKN